MTSPPVHDAQPRSNPLWNAAATARPAAVVRCTSTADVQAAIRSAREQDLPLTVRGGGHDWAGRALADGALAVDLSAMRHVEVDRTTSVATVAGGATATDVATAAHRAGLVAVTGTAGSVGMVGLTTGGGYGPLSGRFGLAADNLLSAEVVLADGTVVVADDEHHPDLLWALRGGGCNVGVVTSIRVQLHRVPALLAGMMLFPLDVLPALEDWLLRGPDELTVQAGFMTPPGGTLSLFAAPTWCGEQDAGVEALRRLAEVGPPLVEEVGPTTQPEQLAGIDALYPPGRHVHIGTRTVTSLDPTVGAALLGAARGMTSSLSAISLHSLHGAAARPAPDATAFRTRTPHLMIESIAVWEDGDPAPRRHRDWARTLDALPGGYPNLLGPDELERTIEVFGPNADRLRTVTAHHDPDQVFRATGSIR